MTIEDYIILYLSGRLSVPVSGDVPSPVPDSFVTVEQTGSRRDNKIKTATIAVQSWATSRAEAGRLNKQVEEEMDGLTAYPEVSYVDLNSSYNYTDLTRKKPRYQAIFTVVYNL